MKKGNREISVSASCFLPKALVFPLSATAQLAKDTGFAGIEAVPFRGPVLWGVPRKPAVPVTSGHCHFNPIPIPRKVREFGKGAALTDLILFPPNIWCEKFLAKLAGGEIPISTYFIHDLGKKGVYDSFQPHPDLGLSLDGIINLVEATGFKVTYDLRHFRREKDPRQGGGASPFPYWRTSWKVLNSRGLVDNVHVQYLDLEELEGILADDETIEIAEMLRVISQSDYEGLITVEITMTDLARLIGPRAFLPSVQVSYLSQLRRFVEAQLT